MSTENTVNNEKKRSSKLAHRLKLVVLWPSVALLALAVLLIGSSIASYYLLLYPPVQERVLRFAGEKLSEYLVGDISVERFETNLFSYVELYGIRAVGKSEYRDSVYVGQVTARYWLPGILRKRLVVTSARVRDVRGHIVMEEGSNVMLPFFPMRMVDSLYRYVSDESEPEFTYRSMANDLESYKSMPKHLRQTLSHDIPKPSDWAWQVVLGSVRINGVTAVFRDLSNEMVGEIVDADISARFYSLDSFFVRLRVPEGSYRSPWWDGSIDTIGAEAVITWTGLDVHSLLLKGAGTHVTGSGKLSYFPDGPWDLKAEFITSLRPLPVIYENVPGLGKDGIFEGTASFGGRLYEPIYRAQVKGFGVVYDGMYVESMAVDATYGRDERGRARIRGDSEFGQFDVSASLDMKDLMYGPEFGRYSASGMLTGLDMKRAASKFKFKLPVPIDSGDVRFTADGVCFEIPTTIDLTAEVTGAGLAGGYINAGATVNGNNWTVDGNWGVNRIEGGGRLNWKTGAVSGVVGADMPDPSVFTVTFADGELLRGHLSAAAEFEARVNDLDNISFSADLNGEGIRWRGMLADSIEARVAYKGGELSLHGASGHVSGRVDSAAAFFGYDTIGGSIQADFSMKGDIDDLFISAYIRGQSLRYGAYVLDTLSGFASIEADTIRWNNLYLRGLETTVQSNGSLSLEPNLSLSFSAELFDDHDSRRRAAGMISVNGSMFGDSVRAECRAASVPLDLFDPWIPEEHRMKGLVSLTGEVTGALANPRARVNFKLNDPKYSDYGVYSIYGDAVLSDSFAVAAAMLRLTEGSEAVELRAMLPFLPSSNWAIDETGNRSTLVRARAGSFDVGEIVKFFEIADCAISGSSSFDVGISNSGDGWRTDGRLMVTNGAFQYEPENVNVRGVRFSANLAGALDKPTAAFTLTTGAARVSDLRMDEIAVRGHSNLDTLTVDAGRFVFRDTGFVDVKGHLLYGGLDSLLYNRNFLAQYRITRLPVAAFARVMPGFDMRGGTITGSGAVYAEGGRPLADGTLSLGGLNFSIGDMEPAFGPVSVNLRLADSTVHVAAATARWGRGVFSAQGQAYWGLEQPVHGIDLRVAGSDIAFELPDVVVVGVSNADLRVNDHNGGYVISGRATLGPTSYVRDVNFLDLINEAQIGSDVRRAPDPFLESIMLRVDVDLADNLGVDMNLGKLTMDGRITVGGTAAEPSFVGRVTVTDGFVYYLDRKFSITEASIFNPDLTAINPNLRIIAEIDVVTFSPTDRAEQFTITLSLTGTLENPVVRFTSEPALSELDILSILTFGERLGGMGGDFNSRLANIAAQQVLGIGARRVERLLNLDRVSVSGGNSGMAGGGLTVGVSKSLTTRFNVMYETNTGDLSERRVTARYRLRPGLFLEGQTTNEGENAVDLIFRYSR